MIKNIKLRLRNLDNKHLKKTGRYIGRNVIEMKIKMKAIVQKPLMIKAIKLQPPPSRDLAPCNFWLFPKLTGCRYGTTEEMKEAVTKVIDTLSQENFHGALQKLLDWYKCIAAGGDYFEGD